MIFLKIFCDVIESDMSMLPLKLLVHIGIGDVPSEILLRIALSLSFFGNKSNRTIIYHGTTISKQQAQLLACSELSERSSKTTMYFELYLFFEVKWPQNNCEWDYEQETGCQKVMYQHLEIIIRLTKIFLNLALTFFRQCVVNGILKYEMQNIIVFLCEIKLVPTVIYILLVVYIVLFK